jgi:hypothetical protein
MRGIILVGIAVVALTACSAGDRPLHDLRANSFGPDEFSVVPVGPLEVPDTLTALPEPTPGGVNRTDPNPTGDAIAALGGSQSAAFAGGIPASDSALVASASRFGVVPAIRAELAAADAAYRGRRQLTQWFNILGSDRYFTSYAHEALDAYTELARFRALGIATPSAPPQ